MRNLQEAALPWLPTRAANRAAIGGWLAAAIGSAAALSVYAGASPARMLGALFAVYAFGYVTGSLLVRETREELTPSLAVVRVIAGLELTVIAFFASLVLGLPWSLGPAALLAAAIIAGDRAVFALPPVTLRVRAGGVIAGIFTAALVAPIVIAAMRMAPGEFPPVFFNVDTAYFLEKVHALASTTTFPPESLGVLDGRFSYHFGSHGMAALIARSTGLAPHHALFVIVVPLLTCGMVAAAVLVARRVGGPVPAFIAVPMLLTCVPSFWHPFWHLLRQSLGDVFSSGSLAPLGPLMTDLEFWDVASNVGQNLIADFQVLAAVAAIAAAPSRGWRLAVFLVGSAVLFKAPTGVALVAGFSLAQMVRCILDRSLRPLGPVIAAAAVFGAVYGAFWLLPSMPATYKTVPYALFHLRDLAERGQLVGFIEDVVWLLLPALILLPAAPDGPRWRNLPLAVFAAAPFLIVNALRAEDLRPGRGIDYDWLQVLIAAPLLIRVWILGVASRRWPRLGMAARAAFLAAVLVAVLPSIAVAAYYTRVLIVHPEQGHEFVDNRALAEALQTIPTTGSLIVTNDLRYPAEGFSRNHRQLQVPALFGHQAFVVNDVYETYDFSRDRLELQAQLRKTQWSSAIMDAARRYHWTHLLIRKDYVHPDGIPLERVFDGSAYAVYRFPLW